MRWIGWCIIVASPIGAWSQTSAYQSSDGNSSIFLSNAKASLIFNVSNTQFDLGYLHEGAGKSWLYGFDATGKPSSDFSSLFEKGKTPPAAGGAASFGYHHPFSKDLMQQDQNGHFRDCQGKVETSGFQQSRMFRL